MKKDWKKEAGRDILALGSIPFFIIILARVYILSDWSYLGMFAVSGIVFGILAIFFQSEHHLGLGLIAAILTSQHYKKLLFTTSALLLYTGMVYSAIYLKIKTKRIIVPIDATSAFFIYFFPFKDRLLRLYHFWLKISIEPGLKGHSLS